MKNAKKTEAVSTLLGELKASFSGMADPRRRGRDFRYLLPDVAVAVSMALLRGSSKVTEAAVFIKRNRAFLNRNGLFTNPEAEGGYPSLATLYRLLESMGGGALSSAFLSFSRKFAARGSGIAMKVVAVDGKRMNGTSCGENGKALNVLTALTASDRIPLASETCEEKSNEITAWDALLESLAGTVKGCVFTADAMVRIKDKDGAKAEAIDTVHRIAYSMAVIFDLATREKNPKRKKRGVKEVMTEANADLKFLREILDTDVGPLLREGA